MAAGVLQAPRRWTCWATRKAIYVSGSEGLVPEKVCLIIDQADADAWRGRHVAMVPLAAPCCDMRHLRLCRWPDECTNGGRPAHRSAEHGLFGRPGSARDGPPALWDDGDGETAIGRRGGRIQIRDADGPAPASRPQPLRPLAVA